MSGAVAGKPIHFISAGAGSGKTFSLTRKLEQLLASGEVEPAGVIATTFTRLAANELRERVRRKLVESGSLALANGMEQAMIGTVNGVCGELLERFAFEAGMPPDQRVLDEAQGDTLFYQAMEESLSNDIPLLRNMNAACHRLQILDAQQQLNWRAEVKAIADAARANNQSADDIRFLGGPCADELLQYFPKSSDRDLDRALLNAIEQAIAGIDTDHDRTKTTRDYLAEISGIRAGLYKQRATWSEWIKLSKKMPGAKSRTFAEPIADAAAQYDRHRGLHRDIRFFAEQVFAIAAASLGAYQRIKTERGLIDFVDQEQRLYLLLEDPGVRSVLASELQLLMVDEFQDTSPIQLALFLRLSELAGQVIWVGDIKQSIYGFRGADPMLMEAVIQHVTAGGRPPEILPKSWRSTPELVSYINQLFTPAFAGSLQPDQVALQSARESVNDEPAVECWRLQGRNKADRALALATGIDKLLASGRTVRDKHSARHRALRCGDIAILCRTHSNLDEIAAALAALQLPIRYQRQGLLSTPEGCLALACLRRLIDPLDTLASAEIHTLTNCESPEQWVDQRIDYLQQGEVPGHRWLESDPASAIGALHSARNRLPFLTPIETLGLALSAGRVRETVRRWGPTETRCQHRLNNLGRLIAHARDYQERCAAENQPATSAGLVLWLYELGSNGTDTQASGGSDDAIQLTTHHGAKGLEWPVVFAMDLETRLRPRLWGLSVLPGSDPFKLEDPLAGRRLRYWPSFNGRQSSGIAALDQINASAAGEAAKVREIEEAKRLLYVSLTRPRDTLILVMNNESGEWLDTLAAPWMLPEGDRLELPGGEVIPSRLLSLAAEVPTPVRPRYQPLHIPSPQHPETEFLPLRISPSALSPLPTARVGEILTLGERLPIDQPYDPVRLGSALHAIIATRVQGSDDVERILYDYGLTDILSPASAADCSRRLLDALTKRFAPTRYYCEYPLHYCNEHGQIVSGWIDLLLENEHGFVLIDHKASPRPRSEWGEIALSYSAQLAAYAAGISRVTQKPVLGQWIHFAVSGGLVEVK